VCPIPEQWKPSFYTRLASRPYRADRDEREDRLTEIIAAVLDHDSCAALAAHVVRGWFEAIAAGRAGDIPHQRGTELLAALTDTRRSIQTQVWTQGGRRRLDLLLSFPLSNGEALTACVEAKVDAAPERDQLIDYIDWVQTQRVPGVVVLAAPRSRFPAFARDQVPAGVAEISWEATASLLGSHTPASDAEGFCATNFCTTCMRRISWTLTSLLMSM
jgi:hypothetical protein